MVWLLKILAVILTLALAIVASAFTTVILQAQREFQHFQARAAAVSQQLEALRAEETQKDAYLRLAVNDPEFLARIVRERLGYVGPDETVFRWAAPSEQSGQLR